MSFVELYGPTTWCAACSASSESRTHVVDQRSAGIRRPFDDADTAGVLFESPTNPQSPADIHAIT